MPRFSRARKKKSDFKSLKQSSENTIDNPLENYLNFHRRRNISAEEFEEYRRAQCDRILEINADYQQTKRKQKVHSGEFMAVDIEYVTSDREFFVIPVYDVEHRTRFEHQLNETYSTFAEPLHEIKLKYLCAVHDGSKWCRGEIVGIQTNSNTSMVSVSYEVYLLDYGHTVHVEKENICILKCAHSIKPFVLKCQLSILNKESELAPKERQTICKVLKRLSKYAKKALIYYNGLIPKKSDTYDVLLLTDFPTNIKTTDGIYSLHENYGAFNRTKIQFDEKLCEEWCDQIHRITNNVHDDTLQKKIRVHISHIVSPTEIYVKSVAAERSMNKIRKVIDAYVRKVGENDVNVEWAVGDNCLVRMQNWKTKSDLKLWYRGRIMETDKLNRTFIIFLRDYGRRTEAKGNDLMAISKELADCNDAVQKSSLVISQSWLHTSPEHLHKMIAQYESFAISCKSKNGTVLNIELWATNNSPLEIDCLESWDNIGFNMISVAIRESMESFIAKTQHRYKLSMYERSTEYDSGTIGERYFMDDHLSSEDHDMHSSIHLNSISDANTYKSKINTRKWPPPMPVDKSFVGLVTHITQKGIVYLQEESVISVANDLFVEITNCITRTGARAINKLSWSKGDICFAEFEPDVYHRAVIRRINREDGTCLLKYVDYGTKSVRRLEDLQVATMCEGIPILAHRLFVPHLVPQNGHWSPVIFKEFVRRLLHEQCTVRLQSNVNKIHNFGKILPGSIDPQRQLEEIYRSIRKEKLAIRTDLNADLEEILFVG